MHWTLRTAFKLESILQNRVKVTYFFRAYLACVQEVLISACPQSISPALIRNSPIYEPVKNG